MTQTKLSGRGAKIDESREHKFSLRLPGPLHAKLVTKKLETRESMEAIAASILEKGLTGIYLPPLPDFLMHELRTFSHIYERTLEEEIIQALLQVYEVEAPGKRLIPLVMHEKDTKGIQPYGD